MSQEAMSNKLLAGSEEAETIGTMNDAEAATVEALAALEADREENKKRRAARLRAFGENKFGKVRGSMTRFAEALGIKPQLLNDYLQARLAIGGKLIERLTRIDAQAALFIEGGNSITESGLTADEKAALALMRREKIGSEARLGEVVNKAAALDAAIEVEGIASAKRTLGRLEKILTATPVSLRKLFGIGGQSEGQSGEGYEDGEVATALRMYDSLAACGVPAAVGEEFKRVDINGLVTKRVETTFLVQAVGDSMMKAGGAGIDAGNILVVDAGVRVKQAAEGKVVVARVNGEVTVKRLERRKGKLWLVPENAKFKAIKITAESEFEVLGVVRWVIRKM